MFKRKKAGLRQFLKMLKSHNSVAHDITHVQLLIQKLSFFSEEPIHEYFAQCRYHSNTHDLVSHPRS